MSSWTAIIRPIVSCGRMVPLYWSCFVSILPKIWRKEWIQGAVPSCFPQPFFPYSIIRSYWGLTLKIMKCMRKPSLNRRKRGFSSVLMWPANIPGVPSRNIITLLLILIRFVPKDMEIIWCFSLPMRFWIMFLRSMKVHFGRMRIRNVSDRRTAWTKRNGKLSWIGLWKETRNRMDRMTCFLIRIRIERLLASVWWEAFSARVSTWKMTAWSEPS